MAKIQARVPDEIQDVADAVIRATGLTVSDVVRMCMTRIATERAIPHDLFQPNPETVQAMLDAREGRNMASFATVEALMADLNADD